MRGHLGKRVWLLPVVAGAAIATGALAGCEDPKDAVSDAAVRVAVNHMGQNRLHDDHINVDGDLHCHTPNDHDKHKVTVVCTGKADDGRKIRITGHVTALHHDCLRGDLTAVVGRHKDFSTHTLGTDCDKK